ncbi:HU family DNA-binding protein [Balneola sp. MJW-20]|uniref:HU family DNA-binding protein n=1 Tax=Gracilimonas aurantiaca TaxID=3234185 RepID=UPI003466C010
MSSKITYNDFVDALSRQTGQTKNKSDQFIKELITLVSDELIETGRSGITNLGSFKVVEMSEREGVNPQTGETMIIPAGKRLSFSAFKALKERLNQDMGDQEIIVPDNSEASAVVAKADTEADEPAPDDISDREQSTDTEQPEPVTETKYEEVSAEESEKPEHKESGSPKEDTPIAISTSSDPQDIFEKQLLESSKDLPKAAKAKVSEEKKSSKDLKRPKKRQNRERSNAYLYAAVVFVICFVGFGIWYFSNSGQTANQPGIEPRTFVIDSTSELRDQPGPVSDEQPAEQPEEQIADATQPEEEISEENPANDVTDDIMDETINNESDNFIPATFIVERNDWLYVIAREVYGSSRFWPLIFEANPAYMSDPDLVYESTELQIPALDGQKGAPSLKDYESLAEASLLVADRYDDYNQPEKAQEYREYAGYYQMIANGERPAF